MPGVSNGEEWQTVNGMRQRPRKGLRNRSRLGGMGIGCHLANIGMERYVPQCSNGNTSLMDDDTHSIHSLVNRKSISTSYEYLMHTSVRLT